MSSKLKANNIDEINNLRNLFNENFSEILKVAIKTKANDRVKKSVDIIKDKPESWFEFLSIAIFHANLEMVQYIIQTFGITPMQIPILNPVNLASDILPETQKDKKEKKETFQDVECPIIIQAAIGGNIEVFKYLQEKGFCENFNATGHICLSRKQKNSVISNIIGAAAYYGKFNFLKYIMDNYEKKVNLNFLSTEKKAKIKYTSLIKEFSDYSPVCLAIASETNSEVSIDIIKLINSYKGKIDNIDFKGNNILHLSVIYSKLLIVKYIIEELNMPDLSKDANKDGQTPLGIGEDNKDEEICKYLKNKTGIEDKQIEEDLKELMESKTTSNTKKKKKKKGKKNKKVEENDFGFLNSSEYQETLKIENKINKTEKEEEVIEENENDNYEDNNYKDENKNKHKDEYYGENENENYFKKKNYTQKYNNNYYKGYSQKRYYNYDYGYDNNSRGNNNYYGKNYNNKGYYKKNNYNNYNKNKYEKENEENVPSEVIEKEITKDKPIENNDEQIIVGLNKKIKKQRNLRTKQGDNDKTNKKEEKENPNEGQEEKKNINENKEIVIEDKDQKIEKEERKEEKDQENPQIKEEEYELDDNSDEDFLRENEDEEKVNNEKEEENKKEELVVKDNENPKIVPDTNKEDIKEEKIQNLEDKLDYNELMEKYYSLEQKYEIISKEKEQLQSLLKSTYLKSINIPSTEENIKDLLDLANSELAKKCEKIYQLEEKLKDYDVKNVDKLSRDKLQKMRSFYNEQIDLIDENLNKLNSS